MSITRTSRHRYPQLQGRARSLLWLVLVLLVALALAAGGCQRVSEPEVPATQTVIDSMGRQVELPKQIAKIVSVSPTATEIVFAVGAGDRVVGVDEYSNYPPEAQDLPKVGGYLDVNVEAIVALQPDVVLVSTIHRETVEQLGSLGIKCVVVEPRNVEDVYTAMLAVAQMSGQSGQAQSVIDQMKETIAAVAAKVRDIPADERRLVFYEVWDDPLMSAGPETYIHEIIVLSGGRNLTEDADTDYPIIGYEVVVARDPHVVIYPTYHGGIGLSAETLSDRPGWSGLTAVRENRIQGIDADIVSRGGPRIAEAVAEMARLIYPELFR